MSLWLKDSGTAKETVSFTISQKLQQGQVYGALPLGFLLQSDAVARGSKHLPAADRHQLAAFILPSHVVQHGRVINKGVQPPIQSNRVTKQKEMGIPQTAMQLPLSSLLMYQYLKDLIKKHQNVFLRLSKFLCSTSIYLLNERLKLWIIIIG